jgi:DNA (cytosine-5)-methyltransferase 1
VKILNLYAGIGGNRQKWRGAVTAVEHDTSIAALYQRLYPADTVIIGDAHDYLLQNHQEFEFIWSSPPCQSHSKMIRSGRNRKPRYPDLRLYEQILLLTHDYHGLWLVENVVPYYPPLVPAYRAGRHLFWANFELGKLHVPAFPNFINRQNLTAKRQLMDWLGIHFEENIYYEGNHCPTQILRNCVHPLVGEQIMRAALAHKPRSVKP